MSPPLFSRAPSKAATSACDVLPCASAQLHVARKKSVYMVQGTQDPALCPCSSSDPFFAAFLGMCALGVASVYVYGNRRSLLPPWQGLVGWGSGAGAAGAGGGPWEGVAAAGQGAGGRSVARRHAATGALREALAEGGL